MTETLTLEMDEDLLRNAKQKAAEQRQPLSQWVSGLIAREVEERHDFEKARRRALERLRHGFNLGGTTLTREEVHRRRP